MGGRRSQEKNGLEPFAVPIAADRCYLCSTFVSLRALAKNRWEKDATESPALLSPACAACTFAADSRESGRAANYRHYITDGYTDGPPEKHSL